ncbi:MAG: methionyl-tRNA formyltransferase [Arachnia sp.]
MRLVVAGTPEVALPTLDALVASRHEVVGVLTRPDAPVGRGRRLKPSPVAARAADLGIEVLTPATATDPALLHRLGQLDIDVCPVVAYGALLPQAALDIPRHGWVNLHFSQLPRWRGAAPVQHALMAGDATIGTTCFRIVKQLDAGDVFEMSSQPLPDVTAGELLDELSRTGANQMLAALDAIEAGTTPTPQSPVGATYAPKISVADARLDFEAPAEKVHRRIMGCSPHPGAWCEVNGQRVKVLRSAPAGRSDLAPGRLAATKRQVFVGAGGGSVELLEVQAAGKRRMNAADWARNGLDGALLR